MNEPIRNLSRKRIVTRLEVLFAVGLLSQGTVPLPARLPEVDLSPQPTKHMVDGATMNCVAFDAGPIRIEYMSPWPIAGQRSRADLSLPVAAASADIQWIMTLVPIDFRNDEAVIHLLKQQLPKDAEASQFEPLQRNLLRINGKETAELIVRYAVFGRRMQLSALAAQREPGQEIFVFRVASPAAEFKKVHRTFQASLYSMTGF